MSLRRPTDRDPAKARSTQEPLPPPAPVTEPPGHSGLALRRAGPHSLDEAEERYVAARDAWTAAMRRANSGRSADLASLAITQEAYEIATAEVERWRSGARVAIPIERDSPRGNLEIAVGQEIAWRQVRDHERDHEEERPGPIRRMLRRLAGRD